MVHIGKALRELRKAAGYSVPEVCVKTGLSFAAIQKIESTEDPNCKLHTLKALLDMYDVKLSEFFKSIGE
jgi:transcriptional regulator with XRE-family HTH domain